MPLAADLDRTRQAQTIRLTQQVKAGGCASKLAPGMLSTVLGHLPPQTDPDVLVGFETADDAGIYRLSSDQALVQTVDFFTPMVDDPFTFGRIAATNALSDIYAMGGQPLTALALVCYPQDGEQAVLEAILRGGLHIMGEAECAVIGGHSVRDPETKFGYAVTGLIHPDRIQRNTGARPGDALLFTKALGTGVITTALKQGKADPAWVEAATNSMTTSNRRAAEIATRPSSGVHAMTDVTGFGFMGHARELAFASGVSLHIDAAAIHALPGAHEAIALGCVPSGLYANRDYASCLVEDAAGSTQTDALHILLYDPQTAGGLLIAVDAQQSELMTEALREAGYRETQVVGRVEPGPPSIVLKQG